MKRDWNELRAILEAVEQDRFGDYIGKYGDSFDDSFMTAGEKRAKLAELGLEKRDFVLGHVELLCDAGLLKGIYVNLFDSEKFDELCILRPRMTMEGYDLLDHLRSKKFSKMLQDYCASVGSGVTLDIIRNAVPYVLRRFLNEVD